MESLFNMTLIDQIAKEIAHMQKTVCTDTEICAKVVLIEWAKKYER